MRTSLRRRSAALAAVSALALAGCGASSTEPSAAHSTGGGDAMRIVTSTSVYASLARQVAPEGASVESIVSSAAQDPHSYEASARDKLTLSKADVVVLNGGGYDDFAVRIVDSLPKKPRVVTAVEASETEAGHAHDEHDAHDHGEEAHDHGHEHDEEHGTAGPGDAEGHEGHDHSHGNEHVWYDVHTMQKLVGDLRSTLSEADPGQAGVIDQRAAALDASLADLAERTHELATKAKGKRYLMTEPLPQALLDELGMKDLTPAGLSAAVEEGNEIPPLQMDTALELVQQKKIDVLFFNAQTEDTQTSRLRDAAKKAGIPVVQVRETLEDDQDYQQYMGAALDDIAGALK